MGQLFRYIADGVLDHYGEAGECPICGTQQRLLPINGNSGDDFWDACATCLRTMPLRYIHAKDDESKIAQIVNSLCGKGTLSGAQRFERIVNIADEYRRTPRLPNFIQNDDWPHCCGDFAESLGDAGRSYTGSLDGFGWWGYENDLAIEHGIEGMMGGEDRVSLFRCLTCPNRFWTVQYT